MELSREPIAVVGVAAVVPGARSPLDGNAWFSWLRSRDDGARRLTESPIELSRYGIPPAQSGANSRLQGLLLACVDRCLGDAGYGAKSLATADRTDIIVGSCFALDRQIANALRLRAAEVASTAGDILGGEGETRESLRAAVAAAFPARAHDRIGEMASTIPARIAIAFGCRGRSLAVEAADGTAMAAIEHAVMALRANACDAAIVATGQLVEDGPLEATFRAKRAYGGFDSRATQASEGDDLGEGAGALLLKRLSLALRDGDRIYGCIVGIGAAHQPRTGSFRYATEVDVSLQAIEAAHADARVPPESIQLVETCGGASSAQRPRELTALARAYANAAPVALGNVRARIGQSWAFSGLAATGAVLLSMHRRTLIAGAGEASSSLGQPPFESTRGEVAWPAARDGMPRRAAVHGTSVTGSVYHLVIEEYDSRTSRNRPTSIPRVLASDEASIAIVAIGGRFAQANDTEAFWRNTWSKTDALGRVAESILARSVHFDPDSARVGWSYSEVGAPMSVPESPPATYPVPPLRWASMDDTQRVALVLAEQLRASYGRPLPRGRGLSAVATPLCLGAERRLGAALRFAEIEQVLARHPALEALDKRERDRLLAELRRRYALPEGSVHAHSLDGYLASGAAAIVAGALDLDARPLAVEAACASSLAALDLAVRALRCGRSDFAVVGGIDLGCCDREFVLCSALRLLSPTRIAPFCEGADGFSLGDGAALFLLRRLCDARNDGDPVLAVIRGVGASSDAHSMIAPDAAGQISAIRRAFAEVDFTPDSVQYVEAHGTGTELGDQTELRALAATYGTGNRSEPLTIGSAKSMIGHTLTASGAAGLLRVVLGLVKKTIPPSIVERAIHPGLPLHEIPARVATQIAPWPAQRPAPRRAGVSSFGTGGINFHVLVEEGARAT